MMGFGMGIGLLVLLLFWGLLIFGAAWLVKGVFSGDKRTLGASVGSGAKPREILDQRYARGEIAREEYDRIRQDLGL
ncbi:MAG TPA: SHOCT domain-containing protein [Anaerolineales bacterium]|nr:SHOCT domain-containing protein [Anaerolineales bacterium]